VADEERPNETPRRARRVRNEGAQSSSRPGQARADEEGRQSPRQNGRIGSAGLAARTAAVEVAALTGKHPESVISVERSDEGWQVGIEVVETHRIPDSADILASYEVQLGVDGELMSYRRVRRYARGQLHGECR
jgi:Gas vesicle synthesis protein GvpO